MNEQTQWIDPVLIEPAVVYVPEELYDPEANLPRDIVQGLAVTDEHYLGSYPNRDRKSLYLHDVAYWDIVALYDGDEQLAKQAIKNVTPDMLDYIREIRDKRKKSYT